MSVDSTLATMQKHAPVAKLVRGIGTYWCCGGEGFWRVGSKEGAVDAAEALCRGEGGAGTYRICRSDKVHDGT